MADSVCFPVRRRRTTCSPSVRFNISGGRTAVFTSAIIIACVAVWVVEMVFSLFWPLGLATMIYYGTGSTR